MKGDNISNGFRYNEREGERDERIAGDMKSRRNPTRQ